MSLGLYTKTHTDYLIDDDHPLTFTFDGILGGSIVKCVYLRSDRIDRWYEDIIVSLISTTGVNITDGSQSGWEWRLIASPFSPTPEEWDLVSPGTSVIVDTILGSTLLGDTVTFLPIWVKVSIPVGQKIQVITDTMFRISYTEHLV